MHNKGLVHWRVNEVNALVHWQVAEKRFWGRVDAFQERVETRSPSSAPLQLTLRANSTGPTRGLGVHRTSGGLHCAAALVVLSVFLSDGAEVTGKAARVGTHLSRTIFMPAQKGFLGAPGTDSLQPLTDKAA